MTDTATEPKSCTLQVTAKLANGEIIKSEFVNVPADIVTDIIRLVRNKRTEGGD